MFLITRVPEVSNVSVGNATEASKAASKGLRAIAGAIVQIYSEGGIRAFWVGNGLNVAKIFPESAIKFFSYETSVSTSHEISDESKNGIIMWGVETVLCAICRPC